MSGPGPCTGYEAAVHPRFGNELQSELYGNTQPSPVRVEGTDGGRTLNRTVFGFLPYWVNYAWLRYDLVSVLACFSVDMGPSGTITSWHGFPSVFAQPLDSIHAAGGMAVVTVTCFTSSSIHSIVTGSRETAIATMVDLVESYPVEGVCIDFENVDAADRDSLTTFVEDLRQALDSEVPGSHLSICTPAVDWSGAFDYSELAITCDAMMMMCYAFHGGWSTIAGPCSPLTGWGSTPESPSNMVWCCDDYVIWAPEVHDRLVVGLPYYGHQWETASSSTHSQVQGSCSTLFYTTLADRAAQYGRLWDEESLTPWYAFYSGGWNQGWYDDPESLGLKYDLVRSSDFQGVGIWALGYDGSKPELWDQLEDSFAGEPWSDDVVDNLESSFMLHGPSSCWHGRTEGGQFYGYFYTHSISSGPDVNWAEWSFAPPWPGVWTVDVFIPAGGETAVSYRVNHDGAADTVLVDQSAFQGQWCTLGTWTAGTQMSVVLGDDTGTAGLEVLFDAVRFCDLTGTGGSVSPAAVPRVEGNPGPSVVLALPGSSAARVIDVYDVSGRLVDRIGVPAGCAGGIRWPDGPSASPGVYFAAVRGEGGESLLRFVILGR